MKKKKKKSFRKQTKEKHRKYQNCLLMLLIWLKVYIIIKKNRKKISRYQQEYNKRDDIKYIHLNFYDEMFQYLAIKQKTILPKNSFTQQVIFFITNLIKLAK